MKTACKDCKYVTGDSPLYVRCAAAPPITVFDAYEGEEIKQPFCSSINKGDCELYERREDGLATESKQEIGS